MRDRIFLSKMKRKIDSEMYIKYILYTYYNVPEKEIIILRTDNHKPFLKNGKIKFSLSHKKQYMAMAVSNSDIGIDIEVLQNKRHDKIVERYFFPEERKYIQSACTDRQKEIRFLEIWTQKEAYIKKNNLKLAYIKDIDSGKVQGITKCIEGNIILSVSL